MANLSHCFVSETRQKTMVGTAILNKVYLLRGN